MLIIIFNRHVTLLNSQIIFTQAILATKKNFHRQISLFPKISLQLIDSQKKKNFFYAIHVHLFYFISFQLLFFIKNITFMFSLFKHHSSSSEIVLNLGFEEMVSNKIFSIPMKFSMRFLSFTFLGVTNETKYM